MRRPEESRSKPESSPYAMTPSRSETNRAYRGSASGSAVRAEGMKGTDDGDRPAGTEG